MRCSARCRSPASLPSIFKRVSRTCIPHRSGTAATALQRSGWRPEPTGCAGSAPVWNRGDSHRTVREPDPTNGCRPCRECRRCRDGSGCVQRRHLARRGLPQGVPALPARLRLGGRAAAAGPSTSFVDLITAVVGKSRITTSWRTHAHGHERTRGSRHVRSLGDDRRRAREALCRRLSRCRRGRPFTSRAGRDGL